MTFKQLETYRSAYLRDRDTAHHLFGACLIFAKQLIGDTTPDIDDIALAATWSAWEKFNTIPQSTPFGPWFTRIVRNKITDAHRRQRTRSIHEDSDFVPASPAFTISEQQSMRDNAGDQLELVDLLLDGFTLTEASETLGISVRTARERLRVLKKETEEHV